ncbi:MAG: metallophosphoesterase family protein [Bernardetiaceae bacterium]
MHLTYSVPDCPPGGRRLVIPDIHGCADTLDCLLERIALTPSDQLFLLGDYINKGPKSRAVVDTLIALQSQDFQVFALRGNHEQMLLRTHAGSRHDQNRRIPRLHRHQGLVDERMQILPKYLPFFENLAFYFDLGDYMLVHAGFNFAQSRPFEDTEAMLWATYFDLQDAPTLQRRIIHGHHPNYLPFIETALEKNNAIIPLDNGCVYRRRLHMGNLLCLNLDTLDLYVQRNIETRTRRRVVSS